MIPPSVPVKRIFLCHYEEALYGLFCCIKWHVKRLIKKVAICRGLHRNCHGRSCLFFLIHRDYIGQLEQLPASMAALRMGRVNKLFPTELGRTAAFLSNC